MNDNNNGANDKIRIERYIVFFLMGLIFHFGISFMIPSFTSLSSMVLE